MADKKKIVIVGAKFGEVYLNAFLEEHPRFQPVGLIARGSARARRLAHAHDVPLFGSIDDLPGGIDAACVVVRSSVVGGDGTRLAERLLGRGIAVLQEHPVHPEDIARLEGRAAAHGTVYRVNSFYRDIRAPMAFVRAAADIVTQTGEAPLFARFATSRQLLYSTLDLLCLALAWDPGQVTLSRVGETGPFQILRLERAERWAEVLVQTAMDADDPDQHSLMTHFGQLVWPSGTLTLAASFGPVVWSSALHMPGHLDPRATMYHDRASLGLDVPTGRILADSPASWADAFELDGAQGVRRCLDRLFQSPSDGSEQLALARLWQAAMQCGGPIPRVVHPPPPRVDCDRLQRAVMETAA